MKTTSAILVAVTAGTLFATCSPAQPTSRETLTEGPPSTTMAPAPSVVLRREQPLMGTAFQIQVVATDEAEGAVAVDEAFAEVARVESLISEWQKTSEMTAVNRSAGIAPVKVGPEMLEMVQRSLHFSALTDGAFDITFAGCGHLWSVSKQRIPTEDQVADCLPRVGHEMVTVDASASTVFLQNEGMLIGSGAIGKGYGVDRAAAVLEKRGITNYVVDGGGDVRVRGTKQGTPWTVGIAHPRRRGELLGRLEVSDGAVVTSGDYERFFEKDGVRYHHIIEPRTGKPAMRSIAVTVLAPTATDADALSTGIFVLGPDKGIELAESLDGVEALVVSPDLETRMTSGFAARFREEPTEPGLP